MGRLLGYTGRSTREKLKRLNELEETEPDTFEQGAFGEDQRGSPGIPSEEEIRQMNRDEEDRLYR